MNTLIICLPFSAPGATMHYEYVLTRDGHTVTDHDSVPSAMLPEIGRGGEVVALIPAALLSWHALELPRGIGNGSPRLLTVLQGILEDRLLDEPTQLHMAVAPGASPDGKVWVTTCDKAWLHGHLQALEAVQRVASRIVPEFSPTTGSLRLHACTGDLPQLVITGKAAAGVMRLPLSPAALTLIPAASPGEEVVLLAEPAVAILAEQLLGLKPDLLNRSQRWLDAGRSSWNLAQFDLASSGRVRLFKRWSGACRELLHGPPWRSARWGAALLLLAHVIGLNAWAWKEQSASQAQRAAIQGLLIQTFPKVKVLDAPLQMRRETEALRQASGVISMQDLEPALAALGTALPGQINAQAIDFGVGETRIKGLPLNPQEAIDLSSRLNRQGYGVRLEADTLIIKQELRP